MKDNELLFEQIQELIKQGPIEEAEKLLIELRKKGNTAELNYMISKLLINLGRETQNPKRIDESISKLKQLDDKQFPRVHYYLGTAYLKKYEVLEGTLNIFDSEKLLDNARLELNNFISKNPDEDLHNAYVNLGAIYSKLKRTRDSLEINEYIINRYKSEYGYFNKGYSLYHYSKYTDNPTSCIKESYRCFKIILEDPNIKDFFKLKSKNMIDLILEEYPIEFFEEDDDNDELIEIPVDNDFEFYMINYCWENRLNLNLCDYCQSCFKSTEDSLLIEKMIYTPPEDNNETSLSKFSSYLNQIKMDYISARTLLILSEYEEFDLDSITRNVYLMNTDFDEERDIRVQFLKDSFKNFFNILDKIAVFIKEYLKVEYDDKDIDFKNVWFKPEIKEKLIETDNSGARALFDIYYELEYDHNKKYLRDTRNALTHRYLKITANKHEITDKTVDELKNETFKIAHLIKNAIIYLMRFVKINENMIEKELDIEFTPKKQTII